MAPKKQLVSRSKRPIPPRPTQVIERRTKARHDPPSSSGAPPPPPSSSVPPPFPSPQAQPSSNAAERMAGRVIASGRRINFVYFDANGFSIGQWIRLAGCESFCTMTDRYYPHLIREFYGSLARGADGWTATVRGVTFILTPEVLGHIWRIPTLGATSDHLLDREAGVRCILERDDVRGVTIVSAIQLSVEMRLLHHIVARIFLPKTGRFDYITERELMFMTTLARGLVLNIPGVMLRQMHEAASSSRLCLPYGMALTRVFRHFGVILDGELYRVLHHTDVYDDRSLHRMGYRFIGGRWIRRASGQEPDTDSEDEIRAAEDGAAQAGPSGTAGAETHDSEPSTPPPPPPPAAATPRAPRSAIDQTLRTEVRTLREEFHGLRDELRLSVSELRQEMIAGFASILTAVQSSRSAPAPQPSVPSSSDSPPFSPPAGQEPAQEPEDPLSADQDPAPVVQQDAAGQATEDTTSEATAVQESDTETTAILDTDSQATGSVPTGDPTPPAETEADPPTAAAPPPPVTSRVLGFHTPGFVRRTSGRTRRVSYRLSSRPVGPQIIVCSSDSDECSPTF